MILFPAILWNIDPTLVQLGPVEIRWYGLLFAAGFMTGYHLFRAMLLREDKPVEIADHILMYLVFGTIIGARLGHCLFYEPAYYLSNPLEILMVWKGGLASHGGGIGVIIAMWLFKRKYPDISFLWLADRLVPMIALTGAFIRLGNLFNSEIFGYPTDLPWAFLFERARAFYPLVGRHPTQIYEALAYLSIFILLYYLYRRGEAAAKEGRLSGIFLITIFTARIFIEYFKEVQVPFEQSMNFNMGQWLSVPFVLAGLWLYVRSTREKNSDHQ